MPIASFKPTTTFPIKTNAPTIEPLRYKSIVRDDKKVPLQSLLSYIEGAPWSVTYYSQVLTEHTDLKTLDTSETGITQQYQKINNLELRVNEPLSTAYSSDDSITTVVGAASFYAFMVPNVGDYFTTDVNDGRLGIFHLTNVERRNFNNDTVYIIEYVLDGYADVMVERYGQLESKTIRQYYFSKERQAQSLSPLLRSEDYHMLAGLSVHYQMIVRHYFMTFFQRRYMTLLLPGQVKPVYDSMLVDYLLKIVESQDALELQSLRRIPTDNDIYLSQPQFWSLMESREPAMLAICNQKMALIDKTQLGRNVWLEGLAYSNINYLVYPSTPDFSSDVDTYGFAPILQFDILTGTTGSHGSISDVIEQSFIGASKTYKLIKPVLVDDYYVLSSDFYNSGQDLSVLEILTRDYLQNKTLNLIMLTALLEAYKNWNRLEQYYYGPILLTLIKEADRSAY